MRSSRPATGRAKDSSACARGSKRRFPARSRTPRTPTCSGSRPPLPISERLASSLTRFTSAFRANCSPSFNWRRSLEDDEIATFQEELGALGYRFQFVTLAGFHALNASMFHLAHGYAREGMTAYVALQEHEFELEELGYTATRHQREVGAGYFDALVQALGESSTLALAGSTEEAQFEPASRP